MKFDLVKVFTQWDQYNWSDVSITTGMFDGVHLGHRKLISEVVDRAKKYGRKSVLLTFEPHPRIVLSNEPSFKLLTTYSERIKLLSSTGLDGIFVLPFTKDLSGLTSTEFISQVLVDKLKVSHYIVGYDHRFGKDREGSIKEVQELSKTLNFTFEQLASLNESDLPVSSSRVRDLIQEGKVEEANKFLGYTYMFTGTVVRGAQIGRTLGFPTANVKPEDERKLVPALGVYAVKVECDGEEYLGMLNIGVRPTVNSTSEFPTVEVHLINFTGNLYDKTVSISFLRYIRAEKKFESLDALKAQLEVDKQTILEQVTLTDK